MILLAHLPLLRIADESVAFAGGDLWRMPFDVFNRLSQGAFEDHRKDYDATAPVFYRLDADLDLPVIQPATEIPAATLEMKFPSHNWGFMGRMGLEFILKFHGSWVERARAALLLAAPACGVPESALSATFVRLAEPAAFRISEQEAGTIRVQGDADQEYLFLPHTASAPLSADIISDAEKCLPLLEVIAAQPDLLAAIKALLGATAPSLSSRDQLILGVRAIEALLLPEIRRGLGSTFAKRLSGLLARDETHEKQLHVLARGLYDARSAGIHAEAPRSPEEARLAAQQAYAQQLLAACIRRLAEELQAGKSIVDQRTALDAPLAHFASGAIVPLANPPGLRKEERLLRTWCPIVATFSSGVDMGAKDGSVSWSPLIGLKTDDSHRLFRGRDFGVALMTLNGDEMVSLEERDIRRDFIGQLQVDAEPASVLWIGSKDRNQATTMEGLQPFLRRRDLATTALRLAGYSEFYDPELLGVFFYQGSIRTRFPSVFRQTIEHKMMKSAPEQIDHAGAERAAKLLELLAEYDETARDARVDQVLRLFRHGFDQEYLPQIARASLLLSAIEAMLGRFRAPKEAVQLEHLAAKVAGEAFPEATKWFVERGRTFRNSIAHGEWPAAAADPHPLEQIVDLSRALIPALLRAWLARPDRSSCSPGQALVESL